MTIDLEAIKKVDWQYLVSRAESLLFKSITAHAYQHFHKATNIDWTVHSLIHFGYGGVYHSARELTNLRTSFAQGGIKLFQEFRRLLLIRAKNFDKIAREISKVKATSLGQEEIKQLTENYYQAALYAHNFLLPFPVADSLISKRIFELLSSAPEAERQEWLATLTYPIKENWHTKEERALYNLAQQQRKKIKNINTLIKNHVERFGWIGARGYWFNRAWSQETIHSRLENLRAQHKDVEAAVTHLNQIKLERALAARNLMAELGIHPRSELSKLITLAREFAYLRTWRTDIFYGAGFKARNLFFEIARRANFHQDDVSYLTFPELIKAAEQLKLPIRAKELKERRQTVANVLLDGHHHILPGKAWEEKLKSVIGQKADETHEVTGNIAFPGKVRGHAKVVFTANDIPKVDRGDILVAVMTFPHLVPAMEKAAAFVTDEGGILCHAAIVSREMEKPCIIGTKIATQVLKDGDEVEVDAKKGVVTILNR